MKIKLFAFLMLLILFVQPALVQAGQGDFNIKQSNIGLYVEGFKIDPETSPLSIDGRILYPARTAFSKMGGFLFWYPDTMSMKMLKGSTIIEMRIGSTEAKINGNPTVMDVPPLFVDGVVMVPVRFVAEAFSNDVHWDFDRKLVYVGKIPDLEKIPVENRDNTLNTSKGEPDISKSGTDASRSEYNRYRVIIDAGHGGKDTGAKANGLVEKTLNLDIALRVEKTLKEKGVNVYMTRRTDVYPDLYYRASMANSLNANLFLSIHNNAGHSSYSGIMTLYCPTSKSGFTGKNFAMIVQNELVKKLKGRNIGISSRPELVVLRKTKMPAVIAEVGFLTNSSDSKKLATEAYRQDAAEALANAVLQALRSIK
jgi:N-acetylmuramoyl-L-alanine amidase